MLKSKQKLKKEDINNIFIKKQERLFGVDRSPFFDLKTLSLTNTPNTNVDVKEKVGVIISKKIFKKSVDRNRVKRRFYSILRLMFKNETEIKKEYSLILEKVNRKAFVFYPKKESLLAEFESLKKEVYNVLK